MHQEWYTPEQVADRLQVSVWTVRRWLKSGELPGIRFGGVWRVSEADLAAFIEEQRGKAVA